VTPTVARAELSEFEWNATKAYSAPDAPPARQIPVPVTLARTSPAVGVVAGPASQAATIVDAPAVSTNVAIKFVPETVAVIDTCPGEDPSVACVLACPAASVTALVGETVAAPLTTANATLAPFTTVPFDVTRTTSGVDSGVPTSWTWPFPDTMSTADGPDGPEGSELPPPQAAATITTVYSETASRT
jgi:hypothetical protein